MLISLLTNKNQQLFSDLDPFQVFDTVKSGTFLPLGLFEPVGEGFEPGGLLLAEGEEKELIIRWLLVLPAFRGHCHGEALLSKCFNYAYNLGYKRVSVYLDTDYAKSDVCRGAEGFYESHMFTKADEDYWTAKVADYKRQDREPVATLEDEAMCLYDLFEGVSPRDYDPDIK